MEVLPDTLLRILANPSDISASDLETLEAAITQYPYFQLARTLVARAKYDQQAPDAYDSLGDAAIYAPDRRHLRRVFYEDVRIDWQPDKSDLTEEVKNVEVENSEPSEEATVTDSTAPTIASSEEASEIPAETSAPEAPEPDPEKVEAKSTGVANHDQEEEIVYQELEENLRKLRRAKEESKQEEEDKKKTVESPEASLEASHTDIAAQSPLLTDYLHEAEPISSEPLDIHQQQQNELINKFVNSDTNAIGRLRPEVSDNDDEASDLSEKSGTYNDELVTENLAEIMLKQGKKKKANEIYQQLILKFPEKKAYFAEKIDKLNKI